MNQLRLLIFGGLLAGMLYACIEPYDPSLKLSTEVLIVDGTLTDLAETQVISISRSRVFSSGYTTTLPVTGAHVQVLVNGTQTVSFTEAASGIYYAPDGFRAQMGVGYQLNFTLADGTKYGSSVETMPTGVGIDKIYDAFDEKAIPNTQKTDYTPANQIYVDLKDPAGERNFYRWQWTLWEQQNWCATCQQGRFVVSNSATSDGTCLADKSLASDNFFDYNCAGACWEIIHSTNFDLFADTYSNGLPVIGHLAATIPYYQTQPALVEIRQYSLSRGVYLYYKLFQDQTTNTGGLADTPPSPIVGNITNVANDNEPVVGYFSVSSVTATRYWLTRQNATRTAIAPGLFEALSGGRHPVPEGDDRLPAPFGLRPPAARCVPGETRTPFKPAGWQN